MKMMIKTKRRKKSVSRDRNQKPTRNAEKNDVIKLNFILLFNCNKEYT